MPRCEPVECSLQGFDGGFKSQQSMGRKKREVSHIGWFFKNCTCVIKFKKLPDGLDLAGLVNRVITLLFGYKYKNNKVKLS